MGKRKTLRRTKYIKISNDGRYPKEAYSPTTGKLCAMVRIALPENDRRRAQGLSPLYYSPDNQGMPWVEVGYKTWRIDEWLKAFAEEYLHDVRHWDFFGEEIDIWEGYSNE